MYVLHIANNEDSNINGQIQVNKLYFNAVCNYLLRHSLKSCCKSIKTRAVIWNVVNWGIPKICSCNKSIKTMQNNLHWATDVLEREVPTLTKLNNHSVSEVWGSNHSLHQKDIMLLCLLNIDLEKKYNWILHQQQNQQTFPKCLGVLIRIDTLQHILTNPEKATLFCIYSFMFVLQRKRPK